MKTTTTTDASYLIFEIDVAKKHLRIFNNEFDNELEQVVAAAVEYCEQRAGRVLRQSVEKLTVFRCWEDLKKRLPWQRVLSIDSITYIDSAGSEQTLVEDTDYRLIASEDGQAIVELDADFTQPVLDDRKDAIRIAYTVGVSDLANIPPRAIQAVKLMLSVLWGDLNPNDSRAAQDMANNLLDSLQASFV